VTNETYVYDDLGRLVSASDNLGNIVSYEYDSLGRVVSEMNS
jgi:YD repeat-containing protein